jgi:hypothetical protein
MDANGRDRYAHAAELDLPGGFDPAAVGAAVTVALCGSVDHPPPCRWPNNHDTTPDGHYRVYFVAPPADEPEVRRRIEEALHGGEWEVVSSGPRELRPGEFELLERLAQTPLRTEAGPAE